MFSLAKHTGGDRSEVISVLSHIPRHHYPYFHRNFTTRRSYIGLSRSQLKIFAKTKIASDFRFVSSSTSISHLLTSNSVEFNGHLKPLRRILSSLPTQEMPWIVCMVQLQLVSAIAITKIIISPCCIDRQPSTTMNSPRT
jgi:hypothetical protein